MANIIIKKGEIIDGTGKPRYKADIALEKDKITSIGKIEAKDADSVLDASGLVVAPGFVDIHSHSDYYLLIDQRAESKILQGVTTEVGGNCGYAALNDLQILSKMDSPELVSEVGERNKERDRKSVV